jgi:hypothetical protein
LVDANEEISNMDVMIKDAWREIKEEQKVKRYAQRELRDERSASQELVKHYSGIQNELNAFKSNRDGYIKRQEYNLLEQKYEKLQKEH